MGNDVTDEELMERFRQGDHAAFEVLFTRHAGAVQGFLARMVREGPLAEDLLQATFLSVVRSRERFEPGMRFGPWLMTIAANAARDSLRRRQHRDAFQQSASPPESVAPEVGDPSLRKHLQDALHRLPPDQREAILLHKLEGWSFEEIANMRGITPSAARVRAHRGYEKLRRLLSGLVGQ